MAQCRCYLYTHPFIQGGTGIYIWATKLDSKVTIRQFIEPDKFSNIQAAGTVFKVCHGKTIYKIEKRQDFERILGVGWDYRVINQNGDHFFIKTETVKNWLNKRTDIEDFIVYPDYTDTHFLDRGYGLVFTFVRMPGNRKSGKPAE